MSPSVDIATILSGSADTIIGVAVANKTMAHSMIFFMNKAALLFVEQAVEKRFLFLFRRSRAGGNPDFSGCCWIPVFTGMTNEAAREALFNKRLERYPSFPKGQTGYRHTSHFMQSPP